MKLVVILLCVVLFVVIAATAFFLTQFDPNQFRPALEQALSKSTGTDAKLGSISIVWGLEMGLMIDGLEFREAGGGAGRLLRTGKAKAKLDVKSLKNLLISIQSFELDKPEIFLINWQLFLSGKKSIKYLQYSLKTWFG